MKYYALAGRPEYLDTIEGVRHWSTGHTPLTLASPNIYLAYRNRKIYKHVVTRTNFLPAFVLQYSWISKSRHTEDTQKHIKIMFENYLFSTFSNISKNEYTKISLNNIAD